MFVIWSATTFLLEVPSGAFADAFSRRRLLVCGALLGGLGFALWVTMPSYPGFAAGFVLWGAGSALVSGTFEALVYDELALRHAQEAYAGLIGRATTAALATTLAATALAAPLFALGGYELAGAVSVLVCLVRALLARSLPEAERVAEADGTKDLVAAGPLRRWHGMLRAGLAETAQTRLVRHAVLLVALLAGFLAVEEYFPLLAREMGASTEAVPLLVAVTVAAQALAGLLAGPTSRRPGLPNAWGLAGAAVLTAGGALSGHVSGFLPIAVGYGVLQLVLILADARLQDSIAGPARATVTSVSGLLSELVAIALFAGFALGSAWYGTTVLVAALAVPVLFVAAVLPRWLPGARGTS